MGAWSRCGIGAGMIDVRSREISAELSPAVDWAIEVSGGITDLEADLASLRLSGLDVRGGVNHLRLRLPRPSGTVRLRVEGGTSDARIRRPAEVPIALLVRGGGEIRFDGRRMNSSGRCSPGIGRVLIDAGSLRWRSTGGPRSCGSRQTAGRAPIVGTRTQGARSDPLRSSLDPDFSRLRGPALPPTWSASSIATAALSAVPLRALPKR